MWREYRVHVYRVHVHVEGVQGTVLVAEWYGTWEKLVLHGLALHLVYVR